MNIKYGTLYYRGRRVDPVTFVLGRKDARCLKGFCQTCGCLLRGNKAIPRPDSYLSDLDNDMTPVVQCEDCDCERAAEL